MVINLLEALGDRFRIAYDPSYDPRGVPRDKLDPHMMLVPCERGVILPYDEDHLIVETESRKTKRTLRDMGLRMLQDGDSGYGAFVFHTDDIDEVAYVVKPRRRRHVSEEERARLTEIGRETQFGKEH